MAPTIFKIARFLKKEAVIKKLAKGKLLTAGLHVCTKGHHGGQFALDIIKKNTRKREGFFQRRSRIN
jgi:hypothetical protein